MALTKEEIIAFPPDVFLKKMADPTQRAEIESVWNAQPEAPGGAIAVAEVTPEEQAAIDQAAADAKAQAEQLAAEAARAEQARKDAEAKQIAEKKERIVMDYPILDDAGKVLAHTHLEADNWQEMAEKQKTTNVLITKAYHRAKNRKITQRTDEPVKQLTDQEIETAVAEIRKSDDPKAAVIALRKVAGSDDAEAERKAYREKQAMLDAQAISYEFMRQHISDYNPCDANGKVIGQYITDNNLEWTRDNLEEAFDQVRSQLAPPVFSPAPAPVNAPVAPPQQASVTAAPTPVIETPVAPVVALTPEPPVAAEVLTPVAAPNPPAPRRVPNSGIVPGTTAGRPTGPAPVGLTKQDIAKMTNIELRRRMRDPKLRAEIEAVANAR